MGNVQSGFGLFNRDSEGRNAANNNSSRDSGDAENGTGRGGPDRSAAAYRYPPSQGGLYFGSQFCMGGQRFQALNPESYLFGNLTDLNFLANGPLGFLAQQPPVNMRHTTTVKSQVNVRKDSVKLIKDAATQRYSLEFVFDSDAPCTIIVYLFAQESADAYGNAVYKSSAPEYTSSALNFGKGLSQVYKNPNFQFSLNADQQLTLEEGWVRYPLVIYVETANVATTNATVASPAGAGVLSLNSGSTSSSAEPQRKFIASQATIAVFDSVGDNDYVIKAVKQKITVNGVSYMLQDIYGIEQKAKSVEDNDDSDGVELNSTSECVVCMADARDTTVLPCRHLCLCNPCAEVLRYQSNKCPICRAPFHSLLQIRVAQQVNSRTVNSADEDDTTEVTPGHHFKSIPIVEALETLSALNSGTVAGSTMGSNNANLSATQRSATGASASANESFVATGTTAAAAAAAAAANVSRQQSSALLESLSPKSSSGGGNVVIELAELKSSSTTNTASSSSASTASHAVVVKSEEQERPDYSDGEGEDDEDDNTPFYSKSFRSIVRQPRARSTPSITSSSISNSRSDKAEDDMSSSIEHPLSSHYQIEESDETFV